MIYLPGNDQKRDENALPITRLWINSHQFLKQSHDDVVEVMFIVTTWKVSLISLIQVDRIKCLYGIKSVKYWSLSLQKLFKKIEVKNCLHKQIGHIT